MFKRLIGIDLFSALIFNILALLGTLLLSITVAFVPLALVIAGFNVVLLSVMLLVRLGALARLIDHVTRER